MPLSGIEDAEVEGFPEATLRGDGARNRLVARIVQSEAQRYQNCRVTLSGRGGDDILQLRSGPIRPTSEDCPSPTVSGDSGNDLLVGTRTDDQLLGGAGRAGTSPEARRGRTAVPPRSR